MTKRFKTMAREALKNRISQDEATGLTDAEIIAKYDNQGTVHT